MARDDISREAGRLARRLDELGRISDERGQLTRTFLSPAMGRANARVGGWMRAERLAVREDTVGNLIGRREGARRGARTLLLGSHLDTVRDAGRFDGALGVLLPISALAVLRTRGASLPFAVEVLGFSEEEGVRFASAYLGSKGYCGRLAAADLARRDARGISVREALGRGFVRLRPAHRRSELLGYVETHIEQGPVLEAGRRPLGVVAAIAGQTRGRIVFRGRAGHAGTTPMGLRRDALAGAAEFILAAERLARRSPGLVATVGTIAVEPGAPNVIPAEAACSLDLRHPRDPARRRALRRLLDGARRIARRRKLGFSWVRTQDDGAVACDARLTGRLVRSVRKVQGEAPRLVSGAGHDAVIVSSLAPVAMIFVRCRGGLSHHPDEHARPADLAAALRALVHFLESLAADHGR
ncbi:MAG TPA: allantoate amidohydrolase [Opitutaceae bacterium]|jgi:allantoate deiminase|nr:allantoate amidohydrolase [Opitutaceae bacterium]